MCSWLDGKALVQQERNVQLKEVALNKNQPIIYLYVVLEEER